MDGERIESLTGLVCEERVDSARPDRIEYRIAWQPFWVALGEPLAAELQRLLTEQARAHQPITITYDRETRRVLGASRSAFRAEGPATPPPPAADLPG